MRLKLRPHFSRFVVATAILIVALGLPSSASATVLLQITEIWMGQPGADVTTDWFEITNYGDTAWVSGVDGQLRADDSSQSLANSAEITSLPSISPGESVIVLMEGDGADETQFYNAWNASIPQDLDNIGLADGSGLGLGQPSDGVTLFMGGVQVDFESYAGSTTAQSWDVVLGAYSTVGNASGAQNSAALGGDGGDTPAVGSPGLVPEPSAVVLAVIGLVGLAATARRRLV